MDTSANWINDYLDPPATAQEQADLLTQAGFPLEGHEPVEGGDVRQDFEMTSNRGDCVCHLGLAREIVALSDRTLRVPQSPLQATGPDAASIVKVQNRQPDLCPLYTARVIRGVKVGPSPEWLRQRLEARGDIPRNNLVDLTNFVLFEMGQPTHVFDLAKLEGSRIVIRMAQPNEPFLPIGEDAGEVKLTEQDLVIADASKAVAIAGVKGGALSAVTEATTDVLLEAATFDPVSVRDTSRRHHISSDSSYRFERGVPAGQIEAAADRLTALILEHCGGELCAGVVADGQDIPERRQIVLRTDRCRALLGVDVTDEQMVGALDRLGFEPSAENGSIRCLVPVHRLDVEREVDLIEEVGRVYGHDNIPIAETLQIQVKPVQPHIEARKAVNDALVGMGFIESMTHSLISEQAAAPLLPDGCGLLRVKDDRAGAEAVLRPSLVPSLLRVRAHNHDNGVNPLRLFESAVTFWTQGDEHHEQGQLTLLMDVEQPDQGLRPLRGVIERIVEMTAGDAAGLTVDATSSHPWLSTGARVSICKGPLGWMGFLAPDLLERYGLDDAAMAAELTIPSLYDQFPPYTQAQALPSFPAIERDITVDIDEHVPWEKIHRTVDGLALQHLEAVEFVTTYRGRQVPAGKKALTLRARFREPDHTLTHDQVDPQVKALISALEQEFGAKLRS
jgi:phenylalanyl-tRNA synthetase beta chain